MSTPKNVDPEMSAAAKKRSASQPRAGGRFAKIDPKAPEVSEQTKANAKAGQALAVSLTSAMRGMTETLVEAGEILKNPKALELAQKLATVEKELAEARFLARRWEEAMEGCNTEIRALKIRIEQLKAQAETARRDADGLQVLLATEEEARRAWEATANERQEMIERQTNRIALLQITEANLTTNLNLYTEQLTLISGMLPPELLPSAPTAERLAQYLANLGEMADGWEATANQRQAKIENLELQVKGWKERRADSESRAEGLQVERDQARGEAKALTLENAGLWSRIKELEAKPTLRAPFIPFRRWALLVLSAVLVGVALAFGLESWPWTRGGKHR